MTTPSGSATSSTPPAGRVALTAGKTRGEVVADDVAQLALARLLEIVGEAAGKVSPEFRSAHP